ncbi:MAG TPA: hypothetical protein GX727_00615 [Clostridium sp.]|jgi:hypothetical protein|nr:hypothetical protein [Clostridium sp.]
MNEKNVELKPMRIGDVVDYSIEIFKNNFKTLVFISLIFYIPWVFTKSLIDAYIIKDYVAFFRGYLENASNPLFRYMDIGEVSVLKSLFDLLNIIYNLTIKLIFHAVIMKVVYNYVINKAAAFSYKNIFKIIRDCFKYIWRLAGYKILFYIILGGTLLFSVIGAGISFPFITAITVPVSFFYQEI